MMNSSALREYPGQANSSVAGAVVTAIVFGTDAFRPLRTLESLATPGYLPAAIFFPEGIPLRFTRWSTARIH
jgi:hypothetical protein